MNAQPSTVEPRRERFPVSGTVVQLDVQLSSGVVAIELVDALDAVEVTLRAGQGSWWQQGVSGVLSILGASSEEGQESLGLDAEALIATEIAFAAQRSRLTVRAPRSGAVRAVALDLHVRAPSAAHVFVRTSTARVDISGAAQGVDLGTGSGEIAVQEVAGDTQVRTGSGNIRLGVLGAGGRVRTGSGNITVDSAAGELELVSGSGNLQVGVGAGVGAELELKSGSGTVSSELELLDSAPADCALRVQARTGTGTVLVHRTR